MLPIADYIDYFEHIAESYITPLHPFVMNVDEYMESTRSDIEYPALIISGITGGLKRVTSDDILDNPQCGFILLDHTQFHDFESQKQKVISLHEIGKDILARMIYDKLHNCAVYPFLRDFNAGTVKYEMIGPVFDNDYGWQFSWALEVPADLEYDLNKWTDG